MCLDCVWSDGNHRVLNQEVHSFPTRRSSYLLKQHIKKLQVVFTEDAPTDLATWPELLSVEKVGRVHYLITKNYTPALEAKLQQLHPHFIETVNLTLEEIFIYANQTGGAQ